MAFGAVDADSDQHRKISDPSFPTLAECDTSMVPTKIKRPQKMDGSNQSDRGGRRPGAGRPKGSKDKAGRRHTEATRKAMTMDFLRRRGGTLADIARTTFAVPAKNIRDAGRVKTMLNLYTRRIGEWKKQLEQGPYQHPGFIEVMQADSQNLAPPPLCPGGEDCPTQAPAWSKHWHCEDCRAYAPFLGPPTSIARLVGEGEAGQPEGMRFIFLGWVCGQCLEKRWKELGKAPPTDSQST